MKKETKDTWVFRGMLVVVVCFTIIAVISCGIVNSLRFIKRIFKQKEKTI